MGLLLFATVSGAQSKRGKANHSPSSRAEVKNAGLYLHSPNTSS